MSAKLAQWPRWLLVLSKAFLLAMTLIVPVVIMKGKSATFDEVSHLPAGYSYFVRHSIQYNQQHPPLIKEICALPLLFMKIRVPAVFPENGWAFGQEFLYGQDADRLMFWGRIPAILLSLGLATLVMIWAGKLWGTSAGLLSLFLYATDPTITAHSQLVTTDVGVAFFSTLYLFLLRLYLLKPDWKRLALSGLSLGLALGSKFSAVILIPMTLILLGVAEWNRRRACKEALPGMDEKLNEQNSSRLSSFSTKLAGFGLMLGLAYLVLWIIYFLPNDPLFYLKGMKAVNQDHRPDLHFYLMGNFQPKGWRVYLLVAWLVKTPIPSIILLAVAVGLFLSGKRTNWLDEAFLIVPAIGFFVSYSLLADNMGVRYLIPCFPFFFIFSSRLVTHLHAAKVLLKLSLAALLFWQLTEFVAISPDHLSYFNQVAGGPNRGPEWLDDSNVDWGQGLMQLRDYLQRNQISNYAFYYFGTGKPEYYGINGRRVQDFGFVLRPTMGTVIFSAHCVSRGKVVLDRVFGNGPQNWLLHLKPTAIVGHAYYVYEIW